MITGTPRTINTAARRTQSGKTRYRTTPSARRATSQASRSRPTRRRFMVLISTSRRIFLDFGRNATSAGTRTPQRCATTTAACSICGPCLSAFSPEVPQEPSDQHQPAAFLGTSSAARSHPASVAAPSYVLSKNESNSASGSSAVRTAAYGSRNSPSLSS